MIGTNLKKIREWLGLSPYELAKEIGITRLKWFQIERGDILPDTSLVSKIEKKFLRGVSCLNASNLKKGDVSFPEALLKEYSPIGDNICYLLELVNNDLVNLGKYLSKEFPQVNYKSLEQQMKKKYISLLPKSIDKIEREFGLEKGCLVSRSIRGDRVQIPELPTSPNMGASLSKFGFLLTNIFTNVYMQNSESCPFDGLFSNMIRCHNLIALNSGGAEHGFYRKSNSSNPNMPDIPDVRTITQLVYIKDNDDAHYNGIKTFKIAERWCKVLNNWSKDVPHRPFGAKWQGLCFMQKIFWHDLVEDHYLQKVAKKLLTDKYCHLRNAQDLQIASDLCHNRIPNAGGFWFFYELVSDKTTKKFVELPFDPIRAGFKAVPHKEPNSMERKKRILKSAASSCCMKFVGMPNTNVFGIELLVHWKESEKNYGLEWLIDGDMEQTKMPGCQKDFLATLSTIVSPKIDFI